MAELRDLPIAGKTWFLGVSVRVFPEGMSIQIGRAKAPCPCAGTEQIRNAEEGQVRSA